MSELFEDDGPGRNEPEFTVSEISGAVKRMIEGEFGHVRVRGEIGRVSRPSSGHVYFDLKDDRAVLAAVAWKGQAARFSTRPEEGMEVIAIGRLTTFPGQSKYQMIVDDIRPAGQGALMLMLEKRRQALAAEGLFDPARKRKLPFLPEVIGVVTSPSGAVIRDILHRLRDRFPRHVLVWPVAVQGDRCAPEVAAAIRGFNAIAPGGPVPRPDVIIVARGGGSIEDLWGFNEEIVVRAAAASDIPLISAVGHETDTTLIDHAADVRAPTPTAAAEMAVPVRLDLLAWAGEQDARLSRTVARAIQLRRQRVSDLARALPRPEALVGQAAQRLDSLAGRLPVALRAATARKHAALARSSGALRPAVLAQGLARQRRRVADMNERLVAAIARRRRDEARALELARRQVQGLHDRLESALGKRMGAARDRLDALERLRQTLGYTETLRRGYAVVRSEGHVVTTRAAAEGAPGLEIEFRDGRLRIGAAASRRAGRTDPSGQGSLF